MKITKKTLKKIIKEEIDKVLEEHEDKPYDAGEMHAKYYPPEEQEEDAPTSYDEEMINLILNKLVHKGVKIPDVEDADVEQLADAVAHAIEDWQQSAATSGETWTDSFGRVHKTQKPVEVEFPWE